MLSGRIHDTQAIGRMVGLRELTLYSVTVGNLDFLDMLPDDVKVGLDEVRVLSPVDMSRLKSMGNVSFSDLSVRSGSVWEPAE